ncbi:MAG: hypothetical protein WCX84_06445 [Syntrophales bacterium]|nr:hypothetical protein [Syntrophales bacterium]
MVYSLSIGIAAGLAVPALLVRTRGAHLVLAVLFVSGAALAAFVAHMACFYPLRAAGLAETNWIFAPVIAGITIWAFSFFRLVARHRSSF